MCLHIQKYLQRLVWNHDTTILLNSSRHRVHNILRLLLTYSNMVLTHPIKLASRCTFTSSLLKIKNFTHRSFQGKKTTKKNSFGKWLHSKIPSGGVFTLKTPSLWARVIAFFQLRLCPLVSVVPRCGLVLKRAHTAETTGCAKGQNSAALRPVFFMWATVYGKEETWLRRAAWPETILSLFSCVKHKVNIEVFFRLRMERK